MTLLRCPEDVRRAELANLTALRHELTMLLGQCRQGVVTDCRIIEALAPSGTAKPRPARPNPVPSLLTGSDQAQSEAGSTSAVLPRPVWPRD